MIKYMDAVENKATKVNNKRDVPQVGGKDIGTLLEENITEAQNKFSCTAQIRQFCYSKWWSKYPKKHYLTQSLMLKEM